MPCQQTLLCQQQQQQQHQVKPRANIHDIHQAIIHGQVEKIRQILEQTPIDLNATVCGSTALSLSLNKCNDAIFQLLLCTKNASKKPLDLNKLSKDEKHRLEPALLTACRLGNALAVRLLIKHGADLEAKDNFYHTAIWMATRQRFKELVAYLITVGASVNPSSEWTHSPLYFAVRYSSHRAEIAKLLLLNGAPVFVHSATRSILFCAIIEGNINIAHLIVEAGYNVSADVEIRHNLQTGMLTRSYSLLMWLKHESQNAPSLQRQCRTVIRTVISQNYNGTYFLKHMSQLPLPRSVISYLTLDCDI